MSTPPALAKRVVRRELHSPRTVAAVVVAAIAVLALVWVGVEAVLAAAGQRPLLLSPAAMATDVRGVVALPPTTLVAAGAVLALVGLLLVVLALAPGRRGRHVIAADGTPAIVDDEVIASALVRTASDTAHLDPNRAVASVGRRSAVVRLTPTSGVPVDRPAVQAAVDAQAAGLGVRPAIRARVVVARTGRVA